MNRMIWAFCGRCNTLTEHKLGQIVHYNKYFQGNKLECLKCKSRFKNRLKKLFKTKEKYSESRERL